MRFQQLFPALLFIFLFTGCFTGVEGTRRVELSRSEVQATLPGEEDNLISGLTGEWIDEWKPLKQFIVLDDRAALMFEPNTLPPDPLNLHLAGKTLLFVNSEQKLLAGLDTMVRLVFKDSVRNYYLPVKKNQLNSMKLPMLVDAEIPDRFDSLLRNKKLWVKYPLWQTDSATTIQGLQYFPVTITKVVPGRGPYPVYVYFRNEDKDVYLPVSLPEAGPSSRSFSKQFSLTDPRTHHPGISDENWSLIQKQRVCLGMTKNEARLSLGSPKEVAEGHNSAMLYELWQYSDGSYLIFEDGLLQKFNLSR